MNNVWDMLPGAIYSIFLPVIGCGESPYSVHLPKHFTIRKEKEKKAAYMSRRTLPSMLLKLLQS
jgi:hypothetical protein